MNSKASSFIPSGLIPTANEFIPKNSVKPATTNISINNNVNNGFVVIDPYGSDVSNTIPGVGMNSAAKTWSPTNNSTGAALLEHNEITDSNENERMVQVSWNGSTFFVPESEAFLAEDGSYTYYGQTALDGSVPTDANALINIDSSAEMIEQLPIENGLEWTHGSLTLPAPPKRCLQTIGLPEPIRQHFQTLDIEASKQMPADDERYKEFPTRYHSAYPLDSVGGTSGGTGSFGYLSSVFKVIDRADSQIYALRRLDNVRTTPAIVTSSFTKWRDIRHPGIVSLYNTSIEKGALFFAYAYHPHAVTLKQKFIDQRGQILNESLIWRFTVQILSAIRLVHSKNMALRVIDPIHIILTSGTNVRINSIGIPDIIEFESRKTLSELQSDDLMKVGKVILSLVTRVTITNNNIEDAITVLKTHFSTELTHLTLLLLSANNNSNNNITIHMVCKSISEKIQDEYDLTLASADALHSHLRNEYENGRLLRLLFKLGFINERPDHSHSIEWSETGDRYVLKLFRDYVFHQVQPDGKPALDAGHILTALNKLDTADSEEILLSSRDNKDLLIVTFADVQRCLESAFVDLAQQADIILADQQVNTHTQTNQNHQNSMLVHGNNQMNQIPPNNQYNRGGIPTNISPPPTNIINTYPTNMTGYNYNNSKHTTSGYNNSQTQHHNTKKSNKLTSHSSTSTSSEKQSHFQHQQSLPSQLQATSHAITNNNYHQTMSKINDNHNHNNNSLPVLSVPQSNPYHQIMSVGPTTYHQTQSQMQNTSS
eukprot:gene4334-6135_t